MTANFYGCTSTRHTEFTCMSAFYHKPRWTRDKWCDNCKARYPETIA